MKRPAMQSRLCLVVMGLVMGMSAETPDVIAQPPSNGIVTLLQDTFTASGGPISVGTPNPKTSLAVVGSPLGGAVSDLTRTIRTGYVPSAAPLPPGTKTIPVLGTVDDPTATVTVNGIPATVTDGTFEGSATLTEGPNLITAIATDLAGNTGSDSITVTLDTHPPPIPTVENFPTVTTATSYLLCGTKAAGTSVWINGAEVVSANNDTDWCVMVALAEGDNDLVIETKDEVGNVSAPLTILIITDNLPPVVSAIAYQDIDDVPLNLDVGTNLPKTNFSPVTVTGQVDDSLTTVEINGILANRSARAFDVDVPLALGTNTLTLVATSPNGYVTTQILEVILGTIPTITTIQPLDGTKLYLDAATTLQATAVDAENDAMESQILLDDLVLVDWIPNASYVWIPSESELALHTVEIRVRDNFGGFALQQAEVYVVRVPVPPP